MAKHGEELHLIRPDAVYRTSVLTPIVGFQPVSNAMEVGARFISNQGILAGPRAYAIRGPRLLRGLSGPSWNLFSWISTLVAKIRARAAVGQILRQLPAPASNAVISVDTSPRPTAAAAIVDAVRGLFPIPSTQSAAAAAAMISQNAVNQAAPSLPMPVAGAQAVPDAAAMNVWLSNQWRRG